MDKFWPVVTVAVAVGIGFLLAQNSQPITFTDLETECRVHDSSQVFTDLQPDNSIVFEGNFPIESTNADLSQSYKMKNNKINLRVSASDVKKPDNFRKNCLGSVVYRAETQPIEPGSYLLNIYHDGDRVERKVIQIE